MSFEITLLSIAMIITIAQPFILRAVYPFGDISKSQMKSRLKRETNDESDDPSYDWVYLVLALIFLIFAAVVGIVCYVTFTGEVKPKNSEKSRKNKDQNSDKSKSDKKLKKVDSDETIGPVLSFDFTEDDKKTEGTLSGQEADDAKAKGKSKTEDKKTGNAESDSVPVRWVGNGKPNLLQSRVVVSKGEPKDQTKDKPKGSTLIVEEEA